MYTHTTTQRLLKSGLELWSFKIDEVTTGTSLSTEMSPPTKTIIYINETPKCQLRFDCWWARDTTTLLTIYPLVGSLKKVC